MKTRNTARALSFLMLGAMACLMAPDAFANGGSGTWVVTVQGVPPGDTLKLRSKPKANSPILRLLHNDEQGYIDINGCWNSATHKHIPASKVHFNKPNTWCRFLSDDGIDGFVRAKFLQ